MAALLRQLARYCGSSIDICQPRPVARMAGYIPGEGAVDLDRLAAFCPPERPCIPIIFYRAMLLAADTAAIDALARALTERELAPAPLVVPSLKDRAAAEFVRAALARLKPAAIVTATGFSAAAAAGASTPFDHTNAPVLQAVIATTRRSAWSQSPRGLGPADLAMHVVLPEIDGRVLQGVIAFKEPLPTDDDLWFTAFGSLPELDRVAILADSGRRGLCGRGEQRIRLRVVIDLPPVGIPVVHLQPATMERRHERPGLLMHGNHSIRLGENLVLGLKLVSVGRRAQGVIRHGASEQEGKPRRHFVARELDRLS